MSEHLTHQLHTSLSAFAPDLDRLAEGAVAAGRRRRHRRRAGIAAVGIGAVAGVGAFGAVVLGDGERPPTARDGDWADAPSAPREARLHVGQELDLGRGLTGTVTDSKAGLYELASNLVHGQGRGFVVVVHGPTRRISSFASHGFGSLFEEHPGATVAVTMEDAGRLGMLGLVEKAPVTVPDGWTCEWYLIDDKAGCTSDDGAVASLVIRDGADRAAWVGDPDKGDVSSVYTTEAHDGIFISVQPGLGTTDAQVQELGAGLAWVD